MNSRKKRISTFFDSNYKIVMIAPVAIIFGALLIFPLVQVIRMSFLSWSLALNIKQFTGISNYVKAFKDSYFLNSIRITFILIGGSLSLKLIIALLLAQLFQKKFRGNAIIAPLLILPSFCTPAVIAMVWRIMFFPEGGVINHFLELLHLPTSQWVFNSDTVIPAVIIFDFWRGTPRCFLLLLGGFSMLPRSPFEAAKIDGANAIQRLFYLTIPLLWPVLIVVSSLAAIDTMKVFGGVYVLTNEGGPGRAAEFLYIYVYKQIFRFGYIGYAAATGVILFILVLAMALAITKIRRLYSI